MTDVDVAREHHGVAEWDAAYVLGALSPAERRRFEQHLPTCARCRAGVAELSGLPGLLAGVPVGQVVDDHDASADDLPADLLPRLHHAVARRRPHRLRYAVLSGSAAAAAVVLAIVLWPAGPAGPTGPSAPAPRAGGTSAPAPTAGGAVTLALSHVVDNPLTVDVTLVSEPWGTRLDLRCRFSGDGGVPGPDREYGYQLYATNRAGTTMPVTSWTYGPDTTAEPVGTSKWPVDQITVVEVRADDGTVLLRGTR